MCNYGDVLNLVPYVYVYMCVCACVCVHACVCVRKFDKFLGLLNCSHGHVDQMRKQPKL